MKTKLNNPNFPFAPKSIPIFYGWIVLIASIVGIAMSIPGQTMGVGVFTDHLIQSTGLSRLELSLAYMIGTIGSSLLLPYAGKLFDRWGARVMVVFSSIGLGISLVLLGSEPWLMNQLIIGLGLASQTIPHFVAMVFVFLLIRQMGQGILTMASRNMLSKWFDRNRGLASGISGIFISFSFASAPLFLNGIITQFGWKTACLVLAVLVGIGMTLFGWLVFRDNPEECGMTMDGGFVLFQSKNQSQPKWTKEFTVQEAKKTYTFWIFNLGISAQALIITAITFHIASIGALAGLNRTEAFSLFLPMSIVSVSTNLIAGWLSDHVDLRYLLVTMMGSLATGCVGLNHLNYEIGQIAMIVGIGIAGGFFASLSMVAWPLFYGRQHLGAISGLNMGSMVFASAIGPFLFGWVESLTKSYDIANWICAGSALILGIGAILATNPQKTNQKTGPLLPS